MTSESRNRYETIFDALAACDWEACEAFEPTLGEPTDMPQGSREKLDLLAERVRRGEALFHPDDFQPDEK